MIKQTIFFILIFIAGWLGHMVVLDMTLEKPADITSIEIQEKREKASPGDWVKENQIHVYDSHIVLDIENAAWAKFTDTNSMDPFFDETSNAIEVVPQSEAHIQVGDIVAYESDYASGVIIHRIVEKDVDDQGTYFILKGDNNKDVDPGKVRFEQIKRVLVGVIY